MTPAAIPHVVLARPLCLVGMPGCGKTTVGMRLAAMLNVPFYDGDDEIVAACGKSVSDIFADHGEAYFRLREYEALDRVTRAGVPCVVAAGGGAFIQEDTRALLLQRAICLWLKPSEETLFARVSRKRHRPLLEGGDKLTLLQEMMQARYPFYAAAHLTVDADETPHVRTALCVLAALAALSPELSGSPS